MVLIIDNYDSFTYNIKQYCIEIGIEATVVYNDAVSLMDIERLAPSYIIISPGPCTPVEAGISLQVIQYFAGSIPILGICLGHQAIGQAFGAEVILAHKVMHGKISQIYHYNQGVFAALKNPFQATRYHSLVLNPHNLPSCFDITAWTHHESHYEIMAVRHRHYALEGVQFHPESIMSEQGHPLLANFFNRYRRDL